MRGPVTTLRSARISAEGLQDRSTLVRRLCSLLPTTLQQPLLRFHALLTDTAVNDMMRYVRMLCIIVKLSSSLGLVQLVTLPISGAIF